MKKEYREFGDGFRALLDTLIKFDDSLTEEERAMICEHCSPFEGVGKCENKEKSVLDDVKVKDLAFPLGETKEAPRLSNGGILIIVSKCHKCDAPIYGPQAVRSDASPFVKHSCNCRNG